MTRMTLSILVALALAAPVRAATYEIDAGHSSVGFRIKHLVGKVSGRFQKFEGTFDYVPGKPGAWKATASIDAASIDTSNPKRDEHLRGADFFDAEKCPKLRFASKSATVGKGGKGKLTGDLTLHCATKPVTLDLEVNGPAPDPWGNERAGATATGKLNRKDFGMTWNKTLDKGGLMIGDEVEIQIEIEGVAKAGEKAPEKAAEKAAEKPAGKKRK